MNATNRVRARLDRIIGTSSSPDEIADRTIEMVRQNPAEVVDTDLAAVPELAERNEILVRVAQFCLDVEQRKIPEARPPRIPVVRNEGGAFAKLHKAYSGLTWGMGGPGVVDVDGEEFGGQPCLLPRSWALRPKDHVRRMWQTMFPFVYDHGADDLPLVAASSARFVLSPLASKVMIVASVDTRVNHGELAEVSIGQIARFTKPSVPRLRARDYADVALAFRELESLHVYPPDWREVRVFNVEKIAAPEMARPDMRVLYGLNPIFVRRLIRERVTGDYLTSREYRGWYLINLTGLMALPNERPAMLRYLLRASAEWNAACRYPSGQYDESKVTYRPLEDFASDANALPMGVVSYLSATGALRRQLASRRSDLRDARDRAREDFRSIEARGLWRLEEREGLFRRLPTRAHLAAWARMRSKGGRPLTLPHAAPANSRQTPNDILGTNEP
jgi:hypothetical protein